VVSLLLGTKLTSPGFAFLFSSFGTSHRELNVSPEWLFATCQLMAEDSQGQNPIFTKALL
jgi:hypothetical protein